MGSPSPPTPPNWSAIDAWVHTAHHPPGSSPEGPAASLPQADLELFVDDAVSQADRLNAHWFADHWPDCSVVALVLLLLVALIVQRVRYAPAGQLTVAVRGGLPAFHVIAASDLVLRTLPPRPGTLSRPQLAVGRYLLQPVREGSVLQDAQLSRTGHWDTRLKQLSVIELPVRLGPVEPPLESAVTLLASAHTRRPCSSTLAEDVPLLAVRRVGAAVWVTVALSAGKLDRLRPYLGSSDLFLARAAE